MGDAGARQCPLRRLYAGCLLLSSSDDGSLKRWDLREGRLTHTLNAHQGVVCSTSFSQSGILSALLPKKFVHFFGYVLFIFSFHCR